MMHEFCLNQPLSFLKVSVLFKLTRVFVLFFSDSLFQQADTLDLIQHPNSPAGCFSLPSAGLPHSLFQNLYLIYIWVLVKGPMDCRLCSDPLLVSSSVWHFQSCPVMVHAKRGLQPPAIFCLIHRHLKLKSTSMPWSVTIRFLLSVAYFHQPKANFNSLVYLTTSTQETLATFSLQDVWGFWLFESVLKFRSRTSSSGTDNLTRMSTSRLE